MLFFTHEIRHKLSIVSVTLHRIRKDGIIVNASQTLSRCTHYTLKHEAIKYVDYAVKYFKLK
jgi:hypothetical protein